MQKSLIDSAASSEKEVPSTAPAAGDGGPATAPNGAATTQIVVRPMTREEYKKNHFKTDGEKKFDTHAYRFWGYYVNVALSLIAVWWVERTHSGKGFLEGIGKGFQKIGVNQESSTFLARKSFFLAGGFAVIPPIKWLEDKKVELIKKYNREIYGDKADRDPKIIQSEAEVAIQPKQTWPSVISARFLALIPFYITVGLLWDRTSLLGRMTNPEFRGMSRQAIRDLEKSDPAKFAQMASKGFYFDRPIAWVARKIGMFGAWISGQKETLAHISDLEKSSPGIINSVIKFDEAGKALPFKASGVDPLHSTGPYYFISEAITSAAVAWGIYVITRFTGPFFGKKDAGKSTTISVPAASHPASPPANPEADPPKHDDRQPVTKVDLAGLERQPSAPNAALQAR